jgi:hypothetical protein
MDVKLLERKTVQVLFQLFHDEVLRKSNIKNPEEFLKNNALNIQIKIQNYLSLHMDREKLIRFLEFYKTKDAIRYFRVRNKRQLLELTGEGILFLGSRGIDEISYDQFFRNVIATFLEAALC